MAELTDFQLKVLEYMNKRMSIGDIAKQKDIRKTKRTVHVTFRDLEEMGYAKNVRPGKALGWEATTEGKKVLEEEGLLNG